MPVVMQANTEREIRRALDLAQEFNLKVIIAGGEGHFRPADVTVGDEADGKVEIRSGLQENQQVVASGQFLIDSEANLRGALGRLMPPENEPPAGDDQTTPGKRR